MKYLLAVIATVILVPPFGVADGRAVDDSEGLVVEMSVTVDRTFEAVLVRPFSSFEELPPTALNPVDPETWAGFVEFPTAEDWLLVFEGFEAGGETSRSNVVTLTEIGVDPVVVAGDPTPPVQREIESSTWWLIGAMGFAVAAIGVLAWWTFASRDTDVDDDDDDDDDVSSREGEAEDSDE